LTTTRFYSACCKTTLSATRATIFHKSRIPHWSWFYAIMLTLNLSASPSGGFLARHLDVSGNTAWHMLRKMREQYGRICAQGSKCLRGETVCVRHLSLRKMKTARGRHTLPLNVLAVATERNAFAYVMPRRHPREAEHILDALGVRRRLLCDIDPDAVLQGLRGYRLDLPGEADRAARSDRWAAVANCVRFGLYLQYNLRRWPVSVRRSYLQSYLAEFILRYNFAHDKAMMFPLFMASLGTVEYSEERPARFGRRRLD
jgi:hypothetical protein